MFDWLFGRQEPAPPPLPPTKKQLDYARVLRIAVTKDATRDEVSAMLADAEAANPQLRKEREQKKERKRIEKYGAELVATEQQWERAAEANKWLAVVYRKGKSIKAELLRLNGASINDRGKL
jgi:hypothetical protein